jgi:hypothetical protein
VDVEWSGLTPPPGRPEPGIGCPHAAQAPETAAPEATEAATAAARRIARPPTHGYEATREAAMAAFARGVLIKRADMSVIGGNPDVDLRSSKDRF